MEEYNRSMSSDRISVEWIFGVISNYFKFVDSKRNLKMALSPVGKMYIVSAYTCLYGNTNSHFFYQIPPSLQGQHLGSWSGHAKRCSKGVAS